MSTSGASGLPQVTRRASAAPPPASTGAIASRPAFASREGLAKLVAKNALLTVVTFGFYRFWARTAIRRFYWSNVAIAGERFEYTGTGAELFVGFLIAMMVLAPVLGGFTILQLLMDPESVWASISGVAYAVGLYTFIATALFRARRYRLSRTRWRGIRFSQDGSTWRFIGLTFGWSMVAALTLGIAFPWLRWAQQRYMMRCTLFGDRRFSFDGSPRSLVWRWLLVLAFLAVPFAFLVGGLVAAYFPATATDVDDVIPAETPEQMARMLQLGAAARVALVGTILLPFAFLGAGLAFLNYRIAEFRAFASATRLGDVAVRSEARVGPVIGAALRGAGAFIGGYALIMLVFLPVVAFQEQFPIAAMAVGIPAVIAFIAMFLVGLPVIIELVVRFAILRHVVTTLELTNVETLDAIVQSAAATPRVGEGLADAFDIGTM